MTSPYADASVEIVADFSTFDDDFKRRLEASIRRAARNAGKGFDDIGEAARRSGRSITDRMGEAADRVRGAFSRIGGRGAFDPLADAAQDAAHRIEIALGGPGVRGVLENIGDAARRAGVRLGVDLTAGTEGARASIAAALGPGPGGARKLLEDVGDAARRAATRITLNMGQAAAATRAAFAAVTGDTFGDIADEARRAARRITEAMGAAAAAAAAAFRFPGNPFEPLARNAAGAAAEITGVFKVASERIREYLQLGNPFQAVAIEAGRAGKVIEGSLVRASIEVRRSLAITSGQARSRFDAIADAARAAGRRITAAMTSAATATAHAWRDLRDVFGPVVTRARAAAAEIRVAFSGVGRSLERAMNIGNPFRPLVLRARLAAAAITRAMNSAAQSGLRVLAITAAAGALAGAAGLAGGGAAALTGAAVSLVAALGPMTGALLALPAAAAAAGTAIATLKLGVHGLSDAFAAMDDPKKFAEAIKKLAPAAREFATTVRDLKPAFESMRGSIQQNLFAGLAKTLADLAKNLLPAVRTGLGRMARELNAAAKSLGGFLSTATARNQLAGVFKVAAAAAGELRGALVPITSALLGLVNAAGPGMIRLAAAVRGVAERFAAWVKTASASGRINDMIQTGIDVAKQFGAVLGNIGGIIATVFKAANTAGGGLLNNLQDITGAAEKFLKSGEGQEALGSFFAGISALVKASIPVFIELADLIGTAVAPIIKNLAIAMGPGLTAGLDALTGGLKALIPAAGPVGAAIGSIAGTIGKLAAAVGPEVADALAVVMPAFASLVAGLGAGLAPLIEGIAGGFRELAPAFTPLARLFVILGPILGKLATTFGKVLGSAIGQFAEALIDVAPVISYLAGALGKEFLRAIELILPPILQLASAFIVALLPVFEKLMPVIGDVITVLARNLQPIVERIIEIISDPKTMEKIVLIAGAIGLAVAALPTLIPMIEFVVSLIGALTALSAPVALVAGAALGIGLAFIAAYTAFKPFRDAVNETAAVLGGAAFEAFKTVTAWVNDDLLPALGKLKDTIDPIVTSLSDIWREKVLPAIEDVAKGYTEQLQPTLDAISRVIREDVQPAVDKLTAAYERNEPQIRQVAGWLAELFRISGRVAAVMGGSTARAIIAVGGAIGGYMIENLGKALDGFGRMVRMFNDARDSADRLIGTLNNIGKNISKAAEDIIKGLVSGLTSGKKAIEDVVKSIGGLIPGTLKGVLDSSSPSKVMARLGGDAISGLHAGLLGGVGKVEAAMDQVAAAVARDLGSPVVGVPVISPALAGAFTGAGAPAAALPGAGAIPAQRTGQIPPPVLPGAAAAAPGGPGWSVVQHITLPTGDPEAAAQAAINRIAALIG